jgi:hemoglobin
VKSRFLAGAVLICAGLALPACSSMSHGDMHAAAKSSLYDRLGGTPAIAAVVDDFVNRLLADTVITANKDMLAHFKPEHVAALKFLVTEQVCQVTGGPCVYSGKDMKSAHAGMKITNREWDAMVADFKATLDHFHVPMAEQNELIGIVATTKPDIVTG